jgi:hypothetical protein
MWIDSLVGESGPLVLGTPRRSLAFEEGACVIAGLSASSKPAALPEELGDAIVRHGTAGGPEQH